MIHGNALATQRDQLRTRARRGGDDRKPGQNCGYVIFVNATHLFVMVAVDRLVAIPIAAQRLSARAGDTVFFHARRIERVVPQRPTLSVVRALRGR